MIRVLILNPMIELPLKRLATLRIPIILISIAYGLNTKFNNACNWADSPIGIENKYKYIVIYFMHLQNCNIKFKYSYNTNN